MHLPLVADGTTLRHIAGLHIGPGKHGIDVVDELGEGRTCDRAVGEHDAEIGPHMAGITAEHDDTVGKKDGLFDVVGHQKDDRVGMVSSATTPRVRCAGFPRSARRARKALVHEEDFGLDHEGPGKAHPLPHPARELLGEGRLKAVQADRVDET